MLKFIWFVLLIIFILIGLNIIIDYMKYGKKIFDSFKKVDNEGKMKELLINIFKSEIRDKVLVLERNTDYFIVLTRFNIFLVQIIDIKGIISGNIIDEILKVKKGNIKKLKNPLNQFIKDINLLSQNNIEIKPLIIKANKDCILDIKGFDKRNTCSLEDFSYLLYKLQHSGFKYSEEEIDSIFKKLEELIDGDNKN